MPGCRLTTSRQQCTMSREGVTVSEDDVTRRYRLRAQASAVFTPGSPISRLDLFRGREAQIQLIFESINQAGQNAIIYGERGVGKTSLANVIGEILEQARIADWKLSHIDCDASDTFASIWKKVFGNLTVLDRSVVTDRPSAQRTFDIPETLGEWLDDGASIEDVRKVAALAGGHLIAIIDEFDQVKGRPEIAQQMASAIKTMSNRRTPVTVILVGVADSIEELVAGHASITRNLMQVQMPRMSPGEVGQIITNGLRFIGKDIEQNALTYIQDLVQGLPSAAHRIGLQCAYGLIDAADATCTKTHVVTALDQVIKQMPASLTQAWTTATDSPRPDALFDRVLIGCALTKRNPLGWFFPADVLGPFRAVTKQGYVVGTYSQHLHLLADGRGEVLEKTGEPRKYQFRFRDPLMQSFVIMHALSGGLLDEETLNRFRENLPG